MVRLHLILEIYHVCGKEAYTQFQEVGQEGSRLDGRVEKIGVA